MINSILGTSILYQSFLTIYEKRESMYTRTDGNWWKHWDFMLLDLIVLEAAFMLAYYLRHGSYIFQGSRIYKEMAVMLIAFHIVIVFFMKYYRNILKRGALQEIQMVVGYNVIFFTVLMAYMMLRKNTDEYSRIALVLFFLLDCALMLVIHMVHKNFLLHRRRGERNMQVMLLITDSEKAEELVAKIQKNEYGVTRLAGVILLDRSATGETVAGIPVVADRDTMYEYARQNVVDEILFNTTQADRDSYVERFLFMGITVHIDLEFLLNTEGGMLNRIHSIPVLTTSINTVTNSQIFFKRMLDIIAGIIGMAVTLIAALIFGPIIYFQSPGPIFFTQNRVGRNGRQFKIIKFRSMYVDAEARKEELLVHNEMQGLMFKMEDDPRVTPIGRFLRRTSIDELPQFFNILRGDMSLVGTRPPTVDEYEKYDSVHKSRLATKPGLTGLWQVSGRSRITDFEEVVRLDNEYIRNWSFWLDLKIIWKTIGVVLKGEGAK